MRFSSCFTCVGIDHFKKPAEGLKVGRFQAAENHWGTGGALSLAMSCKTPWRYKSPFSGEAMWRIVAVHARRSAASSEQILICTGLSRSLRSMFDIRSMQYILFINANGSSRSQKCLISKILQIFK